MRFFLGGAALAAGLALIPAVTWADTETPANSSTFDKAASLFDEGKLLATGGVSQVEGAGGGGLTTWATITGYGTRDGVSFNAHYTYVGTPDYALHAPGFSVGLFNRVELSYARQFFDTQSTGALLGLGQGYTFRQDIYGAKLRLWGDLVYDQDSWLPQIAAGLQFKHNDNGAIVRAVGARSDEGTDFYLAFTKLFLAESVLVDATVRETRANQFGILGFGGDKDGGYSTQFEGSLAYLISKRWAIGAEYRSKPDNLGIAKEDDAWDVFTAYFVNKNLSVTLGYVDLGNIVIHSNQHAFYASVQAGL